MSGWMKFVIGAIVLAAAVTVFKEKFGARFGWTSEDDAAASTEFIEVTTDERSSGRVSEAIETSEMSAEVGAKRSTAAGAGSRDRARALQERASEE